MGVVRKIAMIPIVIVVVLAILAGVALPKYFDYAAQAKVSVTGTIVHVDNRYLAVWVREHGVWRFVAYQPTPIIKT